MLNFYAIRDTKALIYYPPFHAANHVFAQRSVSVGAMDPQSNLNRFPADFELRFLGTFDDITGKLTFVEPEFICTVLSLIPQQKEVTHG